MPWAVSLREPPGGPRSGGEAMSEAKPVRWRPVAKRRGTPKAKTPQKIPIKKALGSAEGFFCALDYKEKVGLSKRLNPPKVIGNFTGFNAFDGFF